MAWYQQFWNGYYGGVTYPGYGWPGVVYATRTRGRYGRNCVIAPPRRSGGDRSHRPDRSYGNDGKTGSHWAHRSHGNDGKTGRHRIHRGDRAHRTHRGNRARRA